ncbi:MAG: DNA polymerase III subunit delta [Bacteroidetes bacterium HGW-Bacteroidetes-2]|jgi:DNA polymerase-3 subunit delta|nr:MAG: DNA polymerase III subunit delta [Bacteroidetes bacterium HGW-Bacteroidetes-2]
MEEAKRIINDIKKGSIKPIYFFTGDEPYYIDFLSNFIEKNLLTEDEKAFNQMVLYGQDVTINDIVSNAKRYPMMAERQVIIIKEAQELAKTIENLESYVENLQPTTVLVLNYKYKNLDKRKKLYKAIKEKGVIFESKKLYENKVGAWIQKTLANNGHGISLKAASMLVEFLGNDLSKISKELEKLTQIVKQGQEITPELIEENIGISKDFNNFELQKAIGSKDIKKSFAIANYFAQNPKSNPLVVTVGNLYRFFSLVLKYHALKSKSDAPKVLGVAPFFVKEYELAARNYPMKKISAVIAKIREIDMKSKGVGAANISDGELLRELLVAIYD